jgi:hypothetical protein
MERGELETLDRETLVVKAQEAGIRRARILTRPELIDELLRLDPKADKATLERSRGFFGVARDLLARVVERGLHLPDAADRIRAVYGPPPSVPRVEPQVVPTVTLAEIYAAQGHPQKAVETLERVLEREPDHPAARALLAKLTDETYVPPPPPLPPEPEVEEVQATAEEEEEEALADTELAAEDEDEDEDEEEEQLADDAAFADDADTIVLNEPVPEDAVTIAMTGPAALPRPAAPHVPSDSAQVTRVLAAECVVVPLSATTAFVWWRAGVPRTDAPFVVRILVVTPSWNGPKTATHDVEVDPAKGELTVRDLPERAVVRAAIGWGTGESFAPVAQAPLLEASSGTSTSKSGLLLWTMKGLRPVELEDPSSRAIADAVRRARAVAR